MRPFDRTWRSFPPKAHPSPFLSVLRAFSSTPLLLHRAIRYFALYAGVLSILTFALRRSGLGTTLELAFIGAFGGAILTGLWAGASFAVEWDEWRSRRSMMPQFSRDFVGAGLRGRFVALIATGVFGGMAFLFWGLATGMDLARIVGAQGVLFSVLVTSLLLGWMWGVLLRADRLAVAFGLITWAPFVTAFAWMPLLVPSSRQWLEPVLNASPLAGILSALGRQNILWTPFLYGRFPYAEYAVRFWGAGIHALIWLMVGASVGLAGFLLSRWKDR